MSSTRTAEDGKARQNRYMSAPEFVDKRGLKGRCVAERASIVERAEERSLLLFLQARSVQDGGLERISRELLEMFPERIGTPSMRKLKLSSGHNCDSSQVRAIRAELPAGERNFRLKGEIDEQELLFVRDEPADPVEAMSGRWKREQAERMREIERDAQAQPIHYPADAFLNACRAAAEGLPHILADLCLNPGLVPSATCLWWFEDIWGALLEYQKRNAQRVADEHARTSISKEVFDTLDFVLAMGGMVVIEGDPRLGKSTATEAWCQMHLGEARYVSIKDVRSDTCFLRQICKALGLACGDMLKVEQMRNSIEEMLTKTKLVLVIDEAHYLFTHSERTKALPHRVNWIMTALVNYGVPVALVCTPQFTQQRIQVEQQTKWSSQQLIGRVNRYRKLPEKPTLSDLMTVARKLLPEGDERSFKLMVGYALASGKYMTAITNLVKEARYAAMQAGREDVTFADLEAACVSYVIPSDEAQTTSTSGRASRRNTASAEPLPHVPEPARTHGVSEPVLVGNGGRIPSLI
ncbi:MAG: ATP-binding protein [Verrucomicrobiales bacterium]|nr:ATP-binding protein [Verrucomicrobiales bacterium]